MNNSQPFQILKMDRRRGNIVVSRRTVLEETRAEQRQELVQNLEEGQVIDGVVKNITDYGAFVDLGGIDAVARHRYRLAPVNHPTEVLSIGQTVKVKIIKINHETHRISLGMKQLLDDPWQGIEAKYPLNARFTGRVTNITTTARSLNWSRASKPDPRLGNVVTKKNMHPGKIVSTSQEVEVQVLEVDSVKRRISLALSRPWRTPGKSSSRNSRSARRSKARSRTRPSSGFSWVSKAMSTAWSICPTRLEAPGEQVIDNFKKGDMVKAWCSTSMSKRSASRSASSSSKATPSRSLAM